MFEPFTDDGAADELTGDSGVDTFDGGGSDRIRDFREGETQLQWFTLHRPCSNVACAMTPKGADVQSP
jgi:hypothetical protein